MDRVEVFSRDSYQSSDAVAQQHADQQRSLKVMAFKNGRSGQQAQVQFGGGPAGGPYKHNWNSGLHQNNRPEDADVRGKAVVVRRPGTKPQPHPASVREPGPVQIKGQPRPANKKITAPKVAKMPVPEETFGPISRPNIPYPPNDPISRKILQKNVTDASVLSAQTRGSDTRWLAWESLMADQKIDSSSNLHYFNLGATGAAFHFDVDGLVKYAGHNHDLITPEQAALVRRGYAFASAKPK